MNPSVRTYEINGRRRRGIIHRLLGAALCAAAATVLPQAQAGLITFEDIDPQLFGHGDTFEQAGMLISPISAADLAQPGDLVGAVVDGTDPGVCAGLDCPLDNSSHYYAALNDGAFFINSADGAASVHLQSFDASFIGAIGGAAYPGVAGLLQVQGFYAGGGSRYELYSLAGPGADGFFFQHFTTTAAFGAEAFETVAIFAYSCEIGAACTAFSDNRAQFAIDNIAAVPEPATWLLTLAGLAGIGALGRRRA